MKAFLSALRPYLPVFFAVWFAIALIAALIFACSFASFEVSSKMPNLTIPLGSICRTAVLLGLGSAVVAMWARAAYVMPPPPSAGSKRHSVAATDASKDIKVVRMDLFLKGIVPLMALTYFVYQALGGAFFATTSVVVAATRSETDPKQLLVTLSVERGAQWVAVISSNAVVWHTTDGHASAPEANWTVDKLPRRPGNEPPVLAAGEKTTTQFEIEKVPDGAFYVTARVVFYAAWWPVPGECLARVRVAALKPPITTARTSAVASTGTALPAPPAATAHPGQPDPVPAATR